MYEVIKGTPQEGREAKPAVRRVDPVGELMLRLLQARRAAIELAACLVAPAEGEGSPVLGWVRTQEVLQALSALEVLTYTFVTDPERGPEALMAEARTRAAWTPVHQGSTLLSGEVKGLGGNG